MKILAPAKINLCLYVLGKRSDGYHDIFSVMQAVSLYDELDLEPWERFVLTVEGAIIDGKNLVEKAWEVLGRYVKPRAGIKVHLRKNIPIGAGLGGGSADAAALIAGANRLFDLGLTREQMSVIGAEVGSDVPFFFSGGSAVVEGRGEVVKPISLPSDYGVVIVAPGFAVDTKWAYSQIRNYLTPPEEIINLLYSGECGPVFEILNFCANSFEPVVKDSFPEIGYIFEKLEQVGARKVLLSGSGSAVFGVFESRKEAHKAADQILSDLSMREQIKGVFYVEPVKIEF